MVSRSLAGSASAASAMGGTLPNDRFLRLLDLTQPEGQAEALARYAPEEKWERVPARAALVKVPPANSAAKQTSQCL